MRSAFRRDGTNTRHNLVWALFELLGVLPSSVTWTFAWFREDLELCRSHQPRNELLDSKSDGACILHHWACGCTVHDEQNQLCEDQQLELPFENVPWPAENYRTMQLDWSKLIYNIYIYTWLYLYNICRINILLIYYEIFIYTYYRHMYHDSSICIHIYILYNDYFIIFSIYIYNMYIYIFKNIWYTMNI